MDAKTGDSHGAVAGQVERSVRRHARTWRDTEGCQQTVYQKGTVTRVFRGTGYLRERSLACELRDTGNGYIARFPAANCTAQDAYVCLDYAQARELVLAFTPHAADLGFAA
jgi:hypothetical protein